MSRTCLVAKPQMLGLASVLGLWGFGASGLWGFLSPPRLAARRVATCQLTLTTIITFIIFTFYFLFILSFILLIFYFIYKLLSLFPCGALAHVPSDGARGAEVGTGWYLGEMGLDWL